MCSVLTDILKLASAAGNTEEILDPVLKVSAQLLHHEVGTVSLSPLPSAQGLEGGGVARYCVCWCLLLRPKLPQSLHVALRPHYPKVGVVLWVKPVCGWVALQVLARCLALAQTHSTRSHTSHLVAMAIELAGHVISIPCQQVRWCVCVCERAEQSVGSTELYFPVSRQHHLVIPPTLHSCYLMVGSERATPTQV